MAAETLTGSTIELDEEINGEDFATRNYRFSKIGESVPIIKSDGSASPFDPQSLPSQPLAVSERFGLFFLVHPQGRGFYVARTKDVMASAEAIKDKNTAPSVQELSLVDVPIGKVSTLALSADDSLLAATVSCHIHFFAVSALLHKEQKPSYSVSLDDPVDIKDIRWAKKDAKAYVILSSDGRLYHGSGQGPLNCVMEGVDSVDWSVRDNCIAVAKNNVVSILTSHFKEKLRFLLSFQSVIGDSDVNQVIKVDSIRWIRPDCLAVGCFQLNDDGEKENYIVQYVTSQGRRITDTSTKPTVLSFNDLFMDFSFDAAPIPTGPHLFLSYLDLYGLAFVANRVSRQVSLFCWPQDRGKNEAVRVEILDDFWILHIDSQDNDEENVLLGLSIDKASQNGNLKFTVGDEETEVSPCCVIICLTIDGKISVFHFACATGALESAEDYASTEEDDASKEPMKHELPLISSAGGEHSRKLTSSTTESLELSGIEVERSSAKVNAANNLSSPSNLDIRSLERTTIEKMGSQTLKVDDPKKALPIVLKGQSNAEHHSTSEVVPSKGFFSGKTLGDVPRQTASSYLPLGSNEKSLLKMLPSWKLSLSGSNARDGASKISDKVDYSDKKTLPSTENILKQSTDFREKPSVTFPSSQVSSGSSFASGRVFQSESRKELNAPSPQSSLLQLGQNASKQFGNVEEMTKKLDNLLESIEGKGGFHDASITSQAKDVAELEQGIWALSDKCGMWRNLLNEKLGETQVLLEKTVEVLARKIYMEGLFKQTADRKYWEFWNRKKLSSELEVKQRRILELNQELTNKLIELERHFNNLEFNKFRENEGSPRDWRTLQNRQGRSRQIQSLHSVHNTINAQLSAAEQLSECLSKQISALCIEPSGKHDAKKQLFESIGLAYVGDGERSPVRDRASRTPANKEYSITSADKSRRNQSSYVEGIETQTARRHSDSLDSSWVSFDPPKSTVKRVLKEDYEKGSPSRPLLNINKQYFSPQTKSLLTHSELSNTSRASLNHYPSKGFGASAGQLTESPLPSTGTKFSFATSEHKVVQPSDTSFRPFPSMSGQLPGQSLTSPFGSIGSSDHLKETIKDQKNQNLVSETYVDTKFPVTSPTALSSAPNVSDKSLTGKNSIKASSPDDGRSASSSRQSLWGSSSALSNNYPSPSSVSRPSSTLFMASSLRSEGSMVAKDDLTQQQTSVVTPTVLPSALPPSTGGSNFASESSSSIIKSQSFFANYGSKTESQTKVDNAPSKTETGDQITSASQPGLAVSTSDLKLRTLASSVPTESSSSSIIKSQSSFAIFGSKTELQNKVDNVPSKTETGDKIQTSASQPGLTISTSDLKLGTSASSVPTELSINSVSGSRDEIGDSSKNSFSTSAINAKIPSATEAISTVVLSSEGVNESMNGAITNPSNEEEMEEEAPETNQTTEFTFANLDGFGIGSTQTSTTAKPNPFGLTALNQNSTFATPPNMMSESSGELFRPASFNFQPPTQPLQAPTVNFSGGFGSGGAGQVSAASGFGQPSQIGAGQQALGSVLGSFGQSRQFGTVLPGSNSAAPSGFGGFGHGFAAAPSSGGFGSLAAGAAGGGFAAAATAGGGFAAAATGGGGFAAAATGGGGFAALATAGSGFAASATGVGGFAGAGAGGGFAGAGAGGGFAGAGANSGGGFGGINNQAGGGGFASSGSGFGRPPSELFTQMRK